MFISNPYVANLLAGHSVGFSLWLELDYPFNRSSRKLSLCVVYVRLQGKSKRTTLRSQTIVVLQITYIFI